MDRDRTPPGSPFAFSGRGRRSDARRRRRAAPTQMLCARRAAHRLPRRRRGSRDSTRNSASHRRSSLPGRRILSFLLGDSLLPPRDSHSDRTKANPKGRARPRGRWRGEPSGFARVPTAATRIPGKVKSQVTLKKGLMSVGRSHVFVSGFMWNVSRVCQRTGGRDASAPELPGQARVRTVEKPRCEALGAAAVVALRESALGQRVVRDHETGVSILSSASIWRTAGGISPPAAMACISFPR